MRTVTTLPDTGQLELAIGEFIEIPEGGTIAERFEAFDKANRWVYYSLVMLVEDWLQRGNRRGSIDMFVHILRWQYGRQTTAAGRFKVNNDFTSRYARKIIAEHPEWADVFYTRELRTD